MELVRHRIASFSQESTRYCNYSKDKFNNQITYIIPCWTIIPEGIYTNVQQVIDSVGLKDDNSDVGRLAFNFLQCENSYNHLIKLGWLPQQARTVLPNGLKTEIEVTANMREWRTIFTQRAASSAHPQMQELMVPLLSEMKEKLPVLFEDINLKII